MSMPLTILRLAGAGAPLPQALETFLASGVRGVSLELGAVPPEPGQVLELCRQNAILRPDVLALHAAMPAALAEALCQALTPGLVHAPGMPGLATWLENRRYAVSRVGKRWVAEAPMGSEEADRLALALAPPGIHHPLRQLVEAHHLLGRWLSRPLPCEPEALVARARALPADEHWALHYRSLIEAADPALLAPTAPLPAGRRRGAARVILLVAADARYVELYGATYLRSVLAHLDVPARVVLHVIGGGATAPLRDRRLTLTADAFDAAAVNTRCHDSDGPRAMPVAHLQSIRFAQAEAWLARSGLPVIVSDIDVILQRGIADLLEQHAADDVVLNRNAASQAFGSHLTANLAMLMPTPGGRAFAADLRGYLDRALARPDVTRWIDQCGLQRVWHAHACAGVTRFGWFDTSSDINNVIYPRWAPNPFRFLSLFHGFDMDSLPPMA